MKVNYLVCDLCSAKNEGNKEWPKDNCIDDDMCVNQEVRMMWSAKIKDKDEYMYEKFDICPRCFRDIIVPFMEERGACLREEKNDW